MPNRDEIPAAGSATPALGDSADPSTSQLLPEVFEELRGLAARWLAKDRHNHTLQATALVNELYMRLADRPNRGWQDRAHFLRAASTIMRHILIDYARQRHAEKRGGGDRPICLTETAVLLDDHNIEILEVDDALRALSTLSPEKARVVELRVFAGCTIGETAEALGISTATAERHWRFARAWLKTRLDADDQRT